MKNLTKNYLLLLLTFFTLGNVNAQNSRTSTNDTVKLKSSVPFDSNAAKLALDEGNSTIKGRISMTLPRGDGAKIFYGSNLKIYLMPVTPYLLDFLELRKQEDPRRLKFAYLSPQAWKYRLEAISNGAGEFAFYHMKPGKYYLEVYFPWQYSGYDSQYVGSEGNTDYYEKQYFSSNYEQMLSKIIEIKKDGSTEKVKLHKLVVGRH